jgi:hypothetical protein
MWTGKGRGTQRNHSYQLQDTTWKIALVSASHTDWSVTWYVTPVSSTCTASTITRPPVVGFTYMRLNLRNFSSYKTWGFGNELWDPIPRWDWVKDPNPGSSTTVIWIGESTIKLCRWESSVINEPRIISKKYSRSDTMDVGNGLRNPIPRWEWSWAPVPRWEWITRRILDKNKCLMNPHPRWEGMTRRIPGEE